LPISVWQAWVLAGLAIFLVLLFAFVVLPYGDPGKKPVGKAPDWALPVIHGGEPGNRIRLSDLRGSVVVLDFWASWCAPCKKQMPILDRVSRAYADEKVVIVGINTDAQRSLALDYLRQRPTSYASLYDEGGLVR